MSGELPDISEGYLLDRRLRYAQPRVGYRTGIEPVLLAAAVPARAGERVLEAGCGAGAGLLCLAARVPGIVGLGIERDAGMAALARHNFAQNRLCGLSVETTDLLKLPPCPEFDHGFANPPWHAEHSTASPSPGRDRAKRAPAGMLAAWIEAMLGQLRPGGSITLILPADQFARACGCVEAMGAGAISLLPLWPREGRAAKLVLVAAWKGRRGPARVLPGLVLHQEQGFSAAAELLLRGGEALCWT